MFCGFVALVGLPNAGKSTLLNRIVGESLAITSPKPQTTRTRVVGIRTTATAQTIFVDTPGLMVAEDELHRRMRLTSARAVRDADVVVHVADALRGPPAPLEVALDMDRPITAPVLIALTRADLLAPASRAALEEAAPAAVFVSGVTGAGVESLLERIDAALPEGPFLYPADDLTTMPMRFIAAEIIREAGLAQLDEEVPHALACEIEEFREEPSPVYIRATLFVERDSQKRILIGAGGARIRAVGSAARPRIEALVGAAVYLDLWVKVLPHWRREPKQLDRLGYRLPE